MDDRAIGEKWERKFGTLAARFGHAITANQINRSSSAVAYYIAEDGSFRRLILPDFVIWSFPGQHHEIKHKSPARAGPRRDCFGLERYRFDSLKHFQSICQQRVFYTIHNYAMAGGKYVEVNRPEDWLTMSIDDMDGSHQHVETDGTSWCNGTCIQTEILYWHKSLFVPLESVLNENYRQTVLPTNPLQVAIAKNNIEIGVANDELKQLRAKMIEERRRHNAEILTVTATRQRGHQKPSRYFNGRQASLFGVDSTA